MQARSVAAGQGWLWIRDGFGLFRQNPVIWIALFFIYLLICMVLSVVPVVGPIVLNLLAPVFVAGFMMGCRALDAGEELEINHLFAGFKHNTAHLITVGGLYLAGIIVVLGVVYVMSGGVLLAADRPEQAMGNIENSETMLLAALVGLAMLLPLVMAYWFAPALVLFHGARPTDAMRTSFFACLANVVPFTLYSLISMVLLVLAMIPLGLGLLVMIPTMTASLYASYRDIFGEEAVAAE